MEQLSLELNERTDEEVIRDVLVQEINNPEYSKHLVVAKLKGETISIRAKSFLCAKVKLTKKVRYIEVRTKNIDYFRDFIASHGALVSDAEEQPTEDTKEWSRIAIDNLEDVLALSKPICIVFMLVLSDLGGERFGCCSRYIECSDKLKCVNPDYIMSLACAYKRNLEAGRVFYGKNKNI